MTSGLATRMDTRLQFDVRSLRLSAGAPSEVPTFAPNREGLKIGGWQWRPEPDVECPFRSRVDLYEQSPKSRHRPGRQAILSRFELRSRRVRRRPESPNGDESTRGEVWAVNASKDGRIAVAAYGDGTIRWRRADDGRELLALQVLANKTDWVLWTPEGFYEATTGAQDVLEMGGQPRSRSKRATTLSSLGHRRAASAGRVAARAR